MNLRRSQLTITCITLCGLTLGSLPAYAVSQTVDASKLLFVLRSAKTVKPNQRLNAVMADKQATILTERNSKASDKDCKIDAVLIAKQLIDSFPDQISRVRVMFEKIGTNQSSRVDVTAGDVKAYALGAMNAESLLSSLDLVDVDTGGGVANGSALSVLPGPMLDKRLLLLSRIESLKSKGTSVKPFQALFATMEAEVSGGDGDKLTKDIAYLSEKLTDQEKMVKQISVHSQQRPQGPSHAAVSQIENSVAEAEPAILNERCKAWEVKLAEWQRSGKDVAQIVFSMPLIRSYANSSDAGSRLLAKKMLDGYDATFKNGPPTVAPPAQ